MKALFPFITFVANLSVALAQMDPDQQPGPSHGLDHGLVQSPININTDKTDEGHHQIQLHYETSHEHIIHGKHLVEIDYDPGSYVIFDERRYEFKQLHFHTPSEHRIDENLYPMEMHMVHVADVPGKPHYLVIALLFEEGEADQFISHFLDFIPDNYVELDFKNREIDVKEELLPGELQEYYHYNGSLTTPPYTESVAWIISKRIHQASLAQIQRLRELEGDNHRGVQKLNERHVEDVKN
jgi:carbonic anhydrase